MTAYFEHEGLTLYQGDCRAVMAELAECSVDAIVTDPPYELGFMAKSWDKRGIAYDPQTWAASLRVLKPGGHLLAFGAPRTYHRMACALEDAGFELRDCLMWIFGSGFPKSLDVSKALDKAAGQQRERIAGRAQAASNVYAQDAWSKAHLADGTRLDDEPLTELATAWRGWGTALKPAYEPIVLARKPLAGTVAANVQAHGTGGLNIDATRIDGGRDKGIWPVTDRVQTQAIYRQGFGQARTDPNVGRWPANVLLDDEAARLLDAQSGESLSSKGVPRVGVNGEGWGLTTTGAEYDDRGGASRFFYTAKTSRAEREFALEDLDPARRSDGRKTEHDVPNLRTNERRNDHPTVKPVDLMRWLCRLVTPPGGLVLDPFLGSGSTGMAALGEGFRFAGIDLEEHYLEIARRRIARRHLLEPMPPEAAQDGARRLF